MAKRAKGWAALAAVGTALGAGAAWADPADTNAPRLADPAPVEGTLNAQMAAAARAPSAPADDGRSAPVSRRVIEAAGAFHGYTRRATALSAHFESGGGVSKALTVGAGYEPGQLAAGAAAYGMLAALQDFAFVDAVRGAASSPDARAALVARLQADPAAVMELPGADEAAVRVAQLIGRRGADLAASGEAVRQAAYAVQKEAWSKGAVEHAAERLQAVKTEGSTPLTLAAADQDELMTGLVALRASPAYAARSGARPTPVVARALAAAAVAALGSGGEEHGDDMMKLLADARGLDCLKMAKLNLYQCLAVAGPHYEDMFCLGRHAMAETGQCLTSAAGWTGPLESAPVLTRAALPVAAPGAGSIAVPMATAAADGPERTSAYAAATLPAESPTVHVARADLPRFEDVPRAAPADRDDPGVAGPLPPRTYASARDPGDGEDGGYGQGRPYAAAPDGPDDDAPPAPPRRWRRAAAYGDPWGGYPGYGPAYAPAAYAPGYAAPYGDPGGDGR